MSDTEDRDEARADDGGFDPESRRLCPDGSCTGVIGPDGKCKICGAESPDGPAPDGAAAPADPAAPASAESADEASAENADEASESEEEPAPAGAHGEDDGDEFDPESRRLCPDDNCIGVIGPDGTCKVCGAESPDGPPPVAAGKAASAAAPPKRVEKKPLPTGKGEAKGFDPDDRILCSDDCCTGLIGPDGKCKECGKPYEG
jgi:hypothetical protein